MHGAIKGVAASAMRMLSDAEIIRRVAAAVNVPHVSKHRQFDANGKHIPGKCRINENSSIKKRMRHWRREALVS